MRAVMFQGIAQVALTTAMWPLVAGIGFADDAADQQDSNSVDSSPETPRNGTDSSRQRKETPVERGKYLVHHVAMCIQCHTSRDEEGNLNEISLLQGAAVPIKSPFAEQQWAFEAPKLAGLPAGFREEDVVRLLRTGKGPRGYSPNPPMPPLRMTKRDAEAVAAYLKSIR